MEASLLHYDGCRVASLLRAYAPPRKPGDPVMWRLVCQDGNRALTLLLHLLPGKGIESPPERITALLPALQPLNSVAVYCAGAFENVPLASERLRHDLEHLAGVKLTKAKSEALVVFIRDELATADTIGPDFKPLRLGQRCNGLDQTRLVQLVEAVAEANGGTVKEIRRRILAAQNKAMSKRTDAARINYLAVLATEPNALAVPVERYIADAWSAEDRRRIEAHARPELLAVDDLRRETEEIGRNLRNLQNTMPEARMQAEETRKAALALYRDGKLTPEDWKLVELYEKHGGNRTKMAAETGSSRSTMSRRWARLERKLLELGVRASKGGGSVPPSVSYIVEHIPENGNNSEHIGSEHIGKWPDDWRNDKDGRAQILADYDAAPEELRAEYRAAYPRIADEYAEWKRQRL